MVFLKGWLLLLLKCFDDVGVFFMEDEVVCLKFGFVFVNDVLFVIIIINIV